MIGTRALPVDSTAHSPETPNKEGTPLWRVKPASLKEALQLVKQVFLNLYSQKPLSLNAQRRQHIGLASLS